VSNQSNWRELSVRATKEQYPEILMAIVEELTGALSQRETAAQPHRNLNDWTRQELNRGELH
jgi:hypothetical protein